MEEIKRLEEERRKAEIEAEKREETFIFLPYDRYLQLSEEEAINFQKKAIEKNKEWFYQKLKERNAQWVIVCGDKVVAESKNLDEYPTEEEIDQIGRKYNLFPFVIAHPSMIEESSWSKISEEDYYPSISMGIKGQEKKHPLIGDLDTGAPRTFLNLNIVKDILRIDLKKQNFWIGTHLGKEYWYILTWIPICIKDDKGVKREKMLLCECVEDWERSPFCIVNPKREALVGRDIMLKFPLKVELDGRNKSTKLFYT